MILRSEQKFDSRTFEYVYVSTRQNDESEMIERIAIQINGGVASDMHNLILLAQIAVEFPSLPRIDVTLRPE